MKLRDTLCPSFPQKLVISVSICNLKQVKKWEPHWSWQQVFHPENAGELCSWRSHGLWPWWAFTLLSDPWRAFPFQSGSSGTPAWGNAKEQGQGESWLPWSLQGTQDMDTSFLFPPACLLTYLLLKQGSERLTKLLWHICPTYESEFTEEFQLHLNISQSTCNLAHWESHKGSLPTIKPEVKFDFPFP